MAYPQLTDKAGALATALAIRTRKISVTEAVDAAITRAGRLDGEIDALAVTDFERACETAKAMDAAPRRLDQNHLGAKIGKEQATVTSPAAGEVENPQS